MNLGGAEYILKLMKFVQNNMRNKKMKFLLICMFTIGDIYNLFRLCQYYKLLYNKTVQVSQVQLANFNL